MKVIGLIGGMSWEPTAHYYRVINEETVRRLGGLHSAPFADIPSELRNG
jgi:aspartate racemase